MARRTLTALGLVAIVVPAIIFGGILYFLLIGIFVGLAAWELVQMFREARVPALRLFIGGRNAGDFGGARAFRPDLAEPVFTCLILLAMTVHLIAY